MSNFEDLKAYGNACYQQGDYTGALAWYNKCLKADAANPIAHSNRAMCLLKLQQPQQAQEACQVGLSILKDSPHNPNLDRLRQKLEYRLQLARAQLQQSTARSDDVQKRKIAIQTVESLPPDFEPL